MKKKLCLIALAWMLPLHCIFDFNINTGLPELFSDKGYTTQVSKALSYSGIACILIPLIARTTAKLIEETKKYSLVQKENSTPHDTIEKFLRNGNEWKRFNKYTKFGAQLIMSGLGIYVGTIAMQAIVLNGILEELKQIKSMRLKYW